MPDQRSRKDGRRAVRRPRKIIPLPRRPDPYGFVPLIEEDDGDGETLELLADILAGTAQDEEL